MRKKVVTPSSILLLVLALCLTVIYIESSSFGSSVCQAKAVDWTISPSPMRTEEAHIQQAWQLAQRLLQTIPTANQ